MFGFIGLVIVKWVEGFENANVTDMLYVNNRPLMVGLSLVNGAAAKGAGIPLPHLPALSALVLLANGI